MKVGMIVEFIDEQGFGGMKTSDVMTLKEYHQNEFRAIHNGNVYAVHAYKFSDDVSQEEYAEKMSFYESLLGITIVGENEAEGEEK